MYSKEMKSLYQKDISKPTSIATLFTRANVGNQPKCPTADEQVKKCGSSTLATEKEGNPVI